MTSNNNRVSHLLPIPETETCPQTGDGGELVEGLPPGCLSMGASKTIEIGVVSWKFGLKCQNCGANRSRPPRGLWSFFSRKQHLEMI